MRNAVGFARYREQSDRRLENALRNLERQAHALFSAHSHIEQLEHERATARLLRLGFGELRSATAPLPTLPPAVEKADWACANRGSVESEQVKAYPGHGSASLQIRPHTTIGYVIEGGNIEKIESFVRSVYLAQRQRNSFAPVFITSCDRFDPFIANNYIFEYVPPRERFASDDARYDEWKRLRLSHIKAKWGISEFITYDSEAAFGVTDQRRSKTSVVVYPDYGSSNPYLEMMYSRMREDFDIVFADPQEAIDRARRGAVVFHLHWEDAVIRTLREEEMPSALAAFVVAIDQLKALGGTFFWTIHNLEPHDTGERELSMEFSRQLYLRADRIHVHDQQSAELLRARFGVEKDILVIEHPSYKGCYPEKLDKAPARRSLDIELDDDDQVFLWFGNVRRYKGVATLLNVAPEFSGRAKFIIAGRSGRYDPRGAPPPNCIRIDGHIDGDKLAALFSAADFIVLPFEEITASGTLLLAMTYGLPVIAPALGGVSSVIRDGNEGFLYSADEGSRALAAAIERAIETPQWHRDAMALAAGVVAAFRPPEAFAAAVRNMFDQASSGGTERTCPPPGPRQDVRTAGKRSKRASGRSRKTPAERPETVVPYPNRA